MARQARAALELLRACGDMEGKTVDIVSRLTPSFFRSIRDSARIFRNELRPIFHHLPYRVNQVSGLFAISSMSYRCFRMVIIRTGRADSVRDRRGTCLHWVGWSCPVPLSRSGRAGSPLLHHTAGSTERSFSCFLFFLPSPRGDRIPAKLCEEQHSGENILYTFFTRFSHEPNLRDK